MQAPLKSAPKKPEDHRDTFSLSKTPGREQALIFVSHTVSIDSVLSLLAFSLIGWFGGWAGFPSTRYKNQGFKSPSQSKLSTKRFKTTLLRPQQLHLELRQESDRKGKGWIHSL